MQLEIDCRKRITRATEGLVNTHPNSSSPLVNISSDFGMIANFSESSFIQLWTEDSIEVECGLSKFTTRLQIHGRVRIILFGETNGFNCFKWDRLLERRKLQLLKESALPGMNRCIELVNIIYFCFFSFR